MPLFSDKWCVFNNLELDSKFFNGKRKLNLGAETFFFQPLTTFLRKFKVNIYIEMINLTKYKEIVSLKKSGLTFAEIGRRLGLTRQRVWQMYSRVVDGNFPTGKKLRQGSELKLSRARKILRSLKEEVDGFVYIIGSRKLMWFKIGMTSNLDSRVRSIRSHIPFKTDLMVSFFIKKCRREEKKLHFRFKNFRMKGEWFNLPEEELKKIIEYFEERQ